MRRDDHFAQDHIITTGRPVTEESSCHMVYQLELSAGQKSVWVAQQLNPSDRSLNIAGYGAIAGAIDSAHFEAALRTVLSEVEALRARFELTGEGLHQVISESLDWSLRQLDFSASADPLAEAEQWMRTDAALEFDMANGPLFRWALIRVEPELYLWYQAMHHIIVDGFGLSLITSRVADVYTDLAAGDPVRECPPTSLAQVIDEHTRYAAGPDFAADREFWLARLPGKPRVASLATRVSSDTSAFIRESSRITPADVDRLRAVARRLRVPWYGVVIAAVAVYLNRVTGLRDIVLGLPVAARPSPVARRTPAMLTNVAPMCLTVDPALDFDAMVVAAAAELMVAHERQRYPYELIIHELSGLPDGRRQLGPEVNVIAFNTSLTFGGFPSTPYNLSAGPVEDMSINIYDRPDQSGMLIEFDGNAGLYRPEELRSHLDRFVDLLRASA
ncbi:condensation domain-containing protein [Nonomuraea insulae]|uniref:Condensation domain-containing protein n=1 Tax=Nonomuraea insulae TaxID=1616787 RepID=A0ABW1CM05_9ACTN